MLDCVGGWHDVLRQCLRCATAKHELGLYGMGLCVGCPGAGTQHTHNMPGCFLQVAAFTCTAGASEKEWPRCCGAMPRWFADLVLCCRWLAGCLGADSTEGVALLRSWLVSFGAAGHISIAFRPCHVRIADVSVGVCSVAACLLRVLGYAPVFMQRIYPLSIKQACTCITLAQRAECRGPRAAIAWLLSSVCTVWQAGSRRSCS